VRLQVLGVRHEEDEGGEAGGADRVALGDGLGRVADRVERVGGGADLVRQVGHLGDTAGVVGDRPVRVDGDDDAGHGEHRHHRDGDTVQAGQLIGDEDAGGDDDHGQGCGLHAHGQTLDDVRRVAGDARGGDALDRAVAGRREVLGDDDDEGGHDDAGDGGKEKPADARDAERLGGIAQHPAGHRVEEHDGDDRRRSETLVEGVHDVVGPAEADEERADDAGDDRHAAEDQRVEHRRLVHDVGVDVHQQAVADAREGHVRAEREEGEEHGGDGRDGVRLEEVGGHARAVADVVADVVGDHAGVARVVFGDAGFDLADQVGADVGGLGVDTAADPGEHADEAAAEAEPDEGGDVACDPVVDGDAEQGEADHEHAGDRAAAEGDLERRPQALLGRLGGAHVDAHADHHADVAGRRRESGADDEPDGHMPSVGPVLPEAHGQ